MGDVWGFGEGGGGEGGGGVKLDRGSGGVIGEGGDGSGKGVGKSSGRGINSDSGGVGDKLDIVIINLMLVNELIYVVKK